MEPFTEGEESFIASSGLSWDWRDLSLELEHDWLPFKKTFPMQPSSCRLLHIVLQPQIEEREKSQKPTIREIHANGVDHLSPKREQKEIPEYRIINRNV